MIRAAVAADLAVVAELIRALADYERMADEVVWTEADLGRHLFGPEPAAHVLLAMPDDDPAVVAGFALWFPTFSTFLGRPGIWLEDLFVRPGHRGQGHGRALLDALRQRTDGRVEWNVLDWNEPSMRFYDTLGARPLPTWVRYRWGPEADRATG